MRLLFVTAESHPSFRADIATLFGRSLIANGVASDLVALAAPGAQRPYTWGAGQALVRPAEGSMGRLHWQGFFHALRHMLFAPAANYNAIQVCDLPLPAAIGLLLAGLKGLRFFYWMSYPIPEQQIATARERGLQAGLARWLFGWLRGRIGKFLLDHVILPHADHVFVQSVHMQSALAARGFDASRMTPVPMGVDLDAMAACPQDAMADPRLHGREVLVYLGSLDRPRRIEGLFAMVQRLRQHRPAVLLVLVGDTEDQPHRQWLRGECDRLGLADHVLWTGWLPLHEGWRWVRAARVALSPVPRGELLDVSSPTKVPEYLALGVPVVCSDNPDQASIVAGSGAGRCVPYTAEAFAAAAEELLAMDDAQRQAIIHAGRQWVAQHRDYAVLAQGLAAKYRQLLQDIPPPGVTARRRPTSL